MNKQIASIVILGTGLLLVGIVFQLSKSKSVSTSEIVNQVPNQKNYMALPETKTSPGADLLEVNDQSNSKTISIKSATLENPGFVMLLKTDKDGSPTDAVGVSQAFTGTKNNIPIELTESSEPGDRLYAMLHTDANTNDKFEWPGPDLPINNEEGEAIMKLFTLIN